MIPHASFFVMELRTNKGVPSFVGNVRLTIGR